MRPTIGRPLANTRIYLLDAHGQPVPVGVAGELYIGGAGVARGYLNRPELTAERFVPDPFATSPGRGCTARAIWRAISPDGNIEFLGRIDYQVKIRGFRIELGEIEAALSQHPAVREAVVLAREDTPGDKRLVAYVVAQARPRLRISRSSCARTCARRCPSTWCPRRSSCWRRCRSRPNGKVDRKALPAPDGAAYASRGYEAPVGEVEETLAQIWAEVLKLERVGRHDNFFELGGHSLLAVTPDRAHAPRGIECRCTRALYHAHARGAGAAVGGESGEVAVPPNGIPADCTAISPEMLPLVELTPEEIERIVAGGAGGRVQRAGHLPAGAAAGGDSLSSPDGARGRSVSAATRWPASTARARLDGYLQAMQAVIDRHDILRTGVVWEGLAEPVQVVWRSAPLAIEEVSLDPAAGDVAEQLRARFDPRRYRLDVRQAPLLQDLHRQGSREGALGDVAVVPPPGDRSHDGGGDAAGDPGLSPWPGGRGCPRRCRFATSWRRRAWGCPGRSTRRTSRSCSGTWRSPRRPLGWWMCRAMARGSPKRTVRSMPQLAKRLRARARALGVSAASLCHLAYAQVLSRVSGREDVVFGTVLFGRMQGGEGAERVLGLFINTLPVRIRIGEQGVEQGVRETHAQLAQLLRHEHASLALAQRASAVAAPAPLFSSFLNYRYTPTQEQTEAADQALAGVESIAAEHRTNYPLQFSIDDRGDGFSLTAKVQLPVDPQRICAYMRTALEQLVIALETSPAAPLRSLQVLPAAERRQLVEEWNDTARDYGREARIHRLIEQQAAATPDSIALEFEGQALSYAEMNGRANQLARLLREKGVGPDVLVGVFAERSIEMVLALLAILKAGGAYVPLDPSYPAERLAHMLEDAQASLVLAQPQLASKLPSQVGDVHLLDSSWAAYAGVDGDDLDDIGTPRDLAYVIFTSGSTGRPKGAMNEHRGVCNRLLWLQEEFGLTAEDRVMQKTAISFDPSVREFFWPLLAGARLVIARPEGHLDTAYLADLIRSQQVTHLQFVPSMLRVFLEQSGIETCSSLKRVLCSGEALTHELQERFIARLPNVELHNLYGPTECSMTVGHWACRQGDEHLTVPIGRPGANVQLYVLDASLSPVPVGVAGELHIGGIQVGRGYAGRPDLTAERFVRDPFSDVAGARLYKTGDLVRYLSDGVIEYIGRIDYQVKFRGFRVELGEIEATLDKHPAVAQSAVMVRGDKSGDQRLVAYVISRKSDLSTAELKQHLSLQLPPYMIPSDYVQLASLPLTASGKVDRKALPAHERSGLDEATYVAPRTRTEEIVAGIWAEVLGLKRVGVEDNFFELGGHSLLAMQVVSRVREALDVELPLRDMFSAPTVKAHSNLIETLVRIRISGDGAGAQQNSEEFVL